MVSLSRSKKKSSSKSNGDAKGGQKVSSSSSAKASAPKKPKEKVEFIPPSVALSARDRAPQLKLSHDQLQVSGVGGGFRMVRATHGVHSGAYYCEVEILPPEVSRVDEHGVHTALPESHVRLGWSTRKGDLQAPLGHDIHGYSYRDTSGSKINNSTRDDDYGESFGPGDIIGLYLKMDLEEVDNEMRFFKNGKDQGVAFRGKDIPLGVYYPAIAVYQYARARINFGPSFILQHDIYGANALSEVQPMNPQDRKEHEQRIRDIRTERSNATAAAAAAAATASATVSSDNFGSSSSTGTADGTMDSGL